MIVHRTGVPNRRAATQALSGCEALIEAWPQADDVPGQQIGDLADGIVSDALEQVAEIVLRIGRPRSARRQRRRA